MGRANVEIHYHLDRFLSPLELGKEFKNASTFINKVLGRLECPSEPRLIYFKAYYHTATSFLLPDPLTGRKHKIELKTKRNFAVLVHRQDLFELKGFFFILFLSGGRKQARRQVEGELP